MTLSEMADHVVLFVGADDSATKTAAKEFIKRRWVSVYDSNPWLDAHALIQLRTTENEVVLPSWADKVVQVREDNAEDARNLQMVSQQDVLLINPGAMDGTGARVAFSPLPSVATQRHPGGYKLTVKSSDSGDTSQKVRVRGLYNGLTIEETLMLAGKSDVPGAYYFDEILNFSKPETAGWVTLSNTNSPVDELQVLFPEETERRHTRIQLLYDFEDNDPEEVITLLVKRRVTPLSHDSDTPTITGLVDALVAHAVADMLERERQFAKAQAKRTEAVSLIAGLLHAERTQGQNHQRIIPDDYRYGEQSTLY